MHGNWKKYVSHIQREMLEKKSVNQSHSTTNQSMTYHIDVILQRTPCLSFLFLGGKGLSLIIVVIILGIIWYSVLFAI